MLIHNSCQSAIKSCLEAKTFAIARLYNGEKTMDIHIHDCYEIYFSISGGKQFLIDNRVYKFEPGDIFFINQFESHYLSEVDQENHERVVISIFPEYLQRFSTDQTDLNYCFTYRDPVIGHRISLTQTERRQFLYFINKLAEERSFGQDLVDQAVFVEMMTFLNQVFLAQCSRQTDLKQASVKVHHSQVDEILSYINQHLAEDLSIPAIASQFYLSDSYLHRIFKSTTGTTVNQYIIAKRIARAKVLLSEGHSVSETCGLCGFRDYSNFFKSFTKIVGISPRKYAACTRS